ncbi:tax1-binding protein 1 B-like [Scleropages formosus]|uniref:Tax1-binding protein 1 B-like n=1 Tax=Scleropages formosus TaxID=113540 RepID=A0A0P7V8X1_SCLFO|nr:tax1-binding protein 1 B-like [Scleropages formosus]
MASFHEALSPTSTMETSNFAHVIFQNVGWSTARDYYTFLWSPLPENYVEGTTVNRTIVFQGYYVPKDDGEFYQFCYVTHKGEIRGASTPFQFCADTPTEDDLLTVEDECNSDILVVTTKASLLEQKVEEAQKEREELMKAMSLLHKEKEQLQQEQERLRMESEQEREACSQLRIKNQELQQSSQILQEEKEDMKRKHDQALGRVHQLEEDLIGVTQRGIQKETELDRDRLKKLTMEKEGLESLLKNERDERELYKIHLKNTELENTKLTTELQMLKSVDMNKEITIAQFQEEVGRLKACVAEKEKLQKEILANSTASEEAAGLKEQLRQTEEQLQATRQQASMLASELRDASSTRDRTMSELYRTRLEVEELRSSLADAQTECCRIESQLEKMRKASQQEPGSGEEAAVGAAAGTEADLQREVEELKLRLQMAAEHYKEKYKECQRLRRQVARLLEQQADSKKSAAAGSSHAAEAPEQIRPESPESPTAGGLPAMDVFLDTMTLERNKGGSKDASERGDKYRKCKQMLNEERERSCMFADELAKMEVKWKEQCRINEELKQQLAEQEDRYKSQVAERSREVMELKECLQQVVKEKENLEEELQKRAQEQSSSVAKDSRSGRVQPVFLQYPLPYPQDPPPASLVQQRPAELQFGNPYSTLNTRAAHPDAHVVPADGADGEFSPERTSRPLPAGPPSWESNVVCIQPSRNLSPPDGLEDTEEHSNVVRPLGLGGTHKLRTGTLLHRSVPAALTELCALFSLARMSANMGCNSVDIHKRCPLCEVIFPPHYEQSKFEEHVESHWKVCPMCSEQFPLDCDQRLFEKHVLTHFDGNVLNFD